MVEDDIYGNEARYEKFKENLGRNEHRQKKHYCKNKANLKHFEKLFVMFEVKDISYIRRLVRPVINSICRFYK